MGNAGNKNSTEILIRNHIIPAIFIGIVMGVPYSSLPEINNTSLLFNRLNLTNISAPRYAPAIWPKCNGPFAYGNAQFTKILSFIHTVYRLKI